MRAMRAPDVTATALRSAPAATEKKLRSMDVNAVDRSRRADELPEPERKVDPVSWTTT
jgi:hypothetical protein